MSKSIKIDGELIQSSGVKLKRVGVLIVWMVVVYTVYLLIVTNSTEQDTVFTVGIFT